MKAAYLTFILLTSTLMAEAQTEEDALRFSRIFSFGSARMTAMGGAFGALGGDLSISTTNPGGIGVFRKSEVSFTSFLDFTHSKSGGRNLEKTPYLIGDLGFVLTFHPANRTWKNVNFSFNYINLNNFNRNIYQGGYSNQKNSLLDVWRSEANGFEPRELNDFTTGLAYETCLINPENNNRYVTPLHDGDAVTQQKNIRERGYQGEYAISGGANYDDKFYFGATLGIQSIHYKFRSTYTEFVEGETQSTLIGFDYDQDYNTNGVGINFKIGAIYRPFPELRLGFAIHTPTYYSMDDEATNRVYSNFTEPPLEDDSEVEWGSWVSTSFYYNLKTPWRLIASAATVIAQKMILSFDYEYVDYSSAKFEGEEGEDYYGKYVTRKEVNDKGETINRKEFVPGANDLIKTIYQGTHNFRTGIEFRINSIFSLRAGYSYWGSPYKKGEMNENNSVQTLSGGFGLNFGSFYTDFAYMNKQSKDKSMFYYYATPYETIESPELQTKYNSNQFKLTIGIRF